MRSLNISSTESSPRVSFDIEKLFFEVSGESRPEDTREFYLPIIEWLDKFRKKTESKEFNYDGNDLNFHFNFDYFNSTSAKYIIDIAKILKSIQDSSGLNVVVKWFYHPLDEDMKECGEEIIDWTDLVMELVDNKN